MLGLSIAAPKAGAQEAAPFIELLIELRRIAQAKQFALADIVRARA